MTLEQLKYFIAAAKYEHINRAAQSIPISASVVSNAVKELENEYQCQFFLRDGRTIRLTAVGSRFLELSQNLLNQAADLKSELQQTTQPLTGHYRIGASHFLAGKVLSPAWTALQKDNSSLTADVFSQPTWSLVDGILAGRLDFAVGFGPSQHPQLESVEIFSGKSQVVVRNNHPIFKRVKKNHYQLLDEYPATMHMASERIMSASPSPALRRAGLKPAITFSYDSDHVALENILHSNNWAFMIDIAASDFGNRLKIISLPKAFESLYSIHIFKHRARKLDAVMAEAYKTIEERVKYLWTPKL